MDKININSRLKNIPKIDKFFTDERLTHINKNIILKIVNPLLDNLRADVNSEINYEKIIHSVINKFGSLTENNMIPVINATGILIHTNLGRAPIAKSILQTSTKDLDRYVTLEYDIKKGARSERNNSIAEILNYLTDAEDVLLVNNNAAAVFLILNTFANRKNVIISRSEIIEIGGKFRLPDMMKKAGAKLCEVGCTNKTYIADYENAVDKKTGIIMKASKSNYIIDGFINEVAISEIVSLAKDKNIVSYFDAGSSHLFTNDKFADILSIKEIINSGVDIVSISADKLLGSIQTGIILGRKELIKKIKSNPIMRLLRLDKLRMNIIVNSLIAYLKTDYKQIALTSFLSRDYATLKKISERIINEVGSEFLSIQDDLAFYGGGVNIGTGIKSISIKVDIKGVSLDKVAKYFREDNAHVIGYIKDKSYLINLYTVQDDEVELLIKSIKNIISHTR